MRAQITFGIVRGAFVTGIASALTGKKSNLFFLVTGAIFGAVLVSGLLTPPIVQAVSA